MPMAVPVSYLTFSNPSMLAVIALILYLSALLISALILQYLHQCSNPPPYKCHTFQPLHLTNLPTHPHPALSPSKPISSPHPVSMPCSSSLPSKVSLHTNRTSLASSWSSSSTTLPLPNSSTLERAQTTSLLHLACPFAPPSPCYLDRSLISLSPTSSTATWKSFPPMSSIQPSLRSSSPLCELNNVNTWNRLDTLLHPQLPYPWPFASCPHLLLLPPIQ